MKVQVRIQVGHVEGIDRLSEVLRDVMVAEQLAYHRTVLALDEGVDAPMSCQVKIGWVGKASLLTDGNK